MCVYSFCCTVNWLQNSLIFLCVSWLRVRMCLCYAGHLRVCCGSSYWGSVSLSVSIWIQFEKCLSRQSVYLFVFGVFNIPNYRTSFPNENSIVVFHFIIFYVVSFSFLFYLSLLLRQQRENIILYDCTPSSFAICFKELHQTCLIILIFISKLLKLSSLFYLHHRNCTLSFLLVFISDNTIHLLTWRYTQYSPPVLSTVYWKWSVFYYLFAFSHFSPIFLNFL